MDPIVPRLGEIVGPGIDAVVGARREVLQWINEGKGRWADIFEIWRAQAALVRNRLADEVAQARLALATGPGLLEFAASECLVTITGEPTRAVGEVTLTRTGAMPRGSFPAGFRFSRQADPQATPIAIEAAEWETVQAVFVEQGQASVTLPLQATRTGPECNVPQETGVAPSGVEIVSRAFDPEWSVASLAMGGGATARSVDDQRKYARAGATSRFGATSAAMVTGTLAEMDAKNAAFLEDAVTGRSFVYPADERWGSSEAYRLRVEKRLRETYKGFGGAVRCGRVTNVFVIVRPTVQLRDASYLPSATDITASLRRSAATYFDTRANWYTWDPSALRAALTRADSRVLTCSSVVVTDRNEAVLAPPTVQAGQATLTHFYLIAVHPTFEVPR